MAGAVPPLLYCFIYFGYKKSCSISHLISEIVSGVTHTFSSPVALKLVGHNPPACVKFSPVTLNGSEGEMQRCDLQDHADKRGVLLLIEICRRLLEMGELHRAH